VFFLSPTKVKPEGGRWKQLPHPPIPKVAPKFFSLKSSFDVQAKEIRQCKSTKPL